jgi:polyribonucleotide nucleotidyltransferase
MVAALTSEVTLGMVYEGKVVSIREFGAFIEILPGTDGLCHVSELDTEYVKNVEDVCHIGDTVKVKVINIDDTGRVKLSRKVVLQEERGETPDPTPAPDRGGDRGGSRGGDRGGNRGGGDRGGRSRR